MAEFLRLELGSITYWVNEVKCHLGTGGHLILEALEGVLPTRGKVLTHGVHGGFVQLPHSLVEVGDRMLTLLLTKGVISEWAEIYVFICVYFRTYIQYMCVLVCAHVSVGACERACMCVQNNKV